MGYVLTAAIVLAVAFAVAGALHVHHETRPADRPSRVATSRARNVMAGDHCLCGGTIGRIADQSGALLGCTGCDRLWTLDGRKINKIVRR